MQTTAPRTSFPRVVEISLLPLGWHYRRSHLSQKLVHFLGRVRLLTSLILVCQKLQQRPAESSMSQSPSLRPRAFLVSKKSGRTPSTQVPLERHLRNLFTPVDLTAPTTPHIIRALRKRRTTASITTGRSRRRSRQLERETPRDTLRNLGRSTFRLIVRKKS